MINFFNLHLHNHLSLMFTTIFGMDLSGLRPTISFQIIPMQRMLIITLDNMISINLKKGYYAH